jgi:hypothetical protein
MRTVMVDMSSLERLDYAIDHPLQASSTIETKSVLNTVLVVTKIIRRYLISTWVPSAQ